RRAGDPNRLCGGEESVRVGDDFITGADVEDHQREPDGVGAVTDAEGVFHAMVARQLLLEALEHGAHDVLAAQEHFLEISVDLFLKVPILAHVSVELHFHSATAMPSRYADYKVFLPAKRLQSVEEATEIRSE